MSRGGYRPHARYLTLLDLILVEAQSALAPQRSPTAWERAFVEIIHLTRQARVLATRINA